MQQSLHRKLTLKQFLAKAVRRSESSACAISPRWMWRKVGSSVSRPWYAGTIPCSAMCRRRSSFRWPKRWGSSGKSEAGCFPPHWPRWGVAATGRGEVPVSVNLSGFQLSASLPELVAQLLEVFSVEAALLTLELTETVLMLDMKGVHRDPRRPERAGDQDRHRRLRDGLLLPGLPQPVAHRHHQAGPLLRGGTQPAGDPGDGGHGHQSGARDPGGRGWRRSTSSRPCRPRVAMSSRVPVQPSHDPGRGGGGGVCCTVPTGSLPPSQTIEQVVDKCAASPIYEVRDAKLNIINRIFFSYHGIH